MNKPFDLLVMIFLLLMCLAMKAHGSELEDIASVISAEACGEGEVGMHAVASTILNRSISRKITYA